MFTVISFVLTFTTFILTDERYYGIDEDKIGGELGRIGAYVEIVVIIEGLFMGPIFDYFGRKIPLVIGFLITGIAVAGIPMFRSLYPAFFILRVMLSCGSLTGLNAPLLPDYVQKESLGKAVGQVEVVINLAFIFASTGMLQIASHLSDEKYIYFALGGTIIIIAFWLIFGLKDVINDPKK